MKTLLSIAAALGVVAMPATASAFDPPRDTPDERGKDSRDKPDGFIPDNPRVPDGEPDPNMDDPGPDLDPKEKPDGWVPDTPKIPDEPDATPDIPD